MLDDSAAPVTRRPQATRWRPPPGAPSGASLATRPDAPAGRASLERPPRAAPRSLPTWLLVTWTLLVALALGTAWLAARGSPSTRALVVVGVLAAVVYLYLALRRT
jgi:hypothetical protein